ncbi:MAG: hypothetical protein EGR14_05450 [Barnesiella intestinihominis]|nr:hypothetical protein [Barnesiella intestinihominis]HBO09288.1 hypothetical protein [Barnesiella sp.]HBX18038.1 hypothetical protein [Barnesiella sp.]
MKSCSFREKSKIPSLSYAKIAKGKSRDKWKSHFRLGYAEPHPIFVVTKIHISESRAKQSSL